MERITQRQLELLVERLNRFTDSPMTSYTRVDDRFVANIGNYHLAYAYGGVNLHRMHNIEGGVTCPIGTEYKTKKELYTAINSYLLGYSDCYSQSLKTGN